MNINKTKQNARNYSSKAKRIEQNNDGKQLVLGGSLFGSKSINDVIDGFDSSVQSSIDDLFAIATYNVGDIRITMERIDPGGLPQVDEWEFEESDYVFQEDENINILGKRVEIKEGYSSENIVLEIKSVVEDYIDEGKYFSEIEQIDNRTLRVTYLDRRNHQGLRIFDKELTQIPYNIDVKREVIYGYGQWVYMGNEEKNLGESSYTLYYYQRVG